MSDDSTLDFVSELAMEFLQRCRAGERPQLREYIEKHPQLEEAIRDVFPMMLLMEDVAPIDGPTDLHSELDLEQLGDFVIHRVIGRGGMGVVYEATQESLGRRVALKVCPLSPAMSSRNRERFRRESRSAALLHHTNIVPVFAVGEEEGMLYYAMQYIRGATLDDVILELRQLWQSAPTATTRLTAGVQSAGNDAALLRSKAASEVAKSLVNNFPGSPVSVSDTGEFAEKAPTPPDVPTANVSLPGQSNADSSGGTTAKYWESVGTIGVQVAEALAYAHDKGTLHRDIKPGNLMLDQAGIVWVMDFGLAKSLDEDDLTQAGELIGTLRYMAPEQCSGKPEASSDIYSLGLTLYELLALRPAYEEVRRSELLKAIFENEPTPPRKINANVPRDLETIVLKAIEREPTRRYASARDLADDLNRFLAGEPIQARAVSTRERFGKWIRRHPLVAALSTALAILFVVSFALVTWNWRVAELARADAVDKELQALEAVDAEKKARAKAAEQRQLAEQRLEQTAAALYRNGISRAVFASSSDPEDARGILESLKPNAGDIDRRGWEWGYLNTLVNQQAAFLYAGAPEAEWIRALAFSHDDSLLAVGAGRSGFVRPIDRSPKGRVTIWSTSTAQLVSELPIEHTAFALAFSHDKGRLAVSEPLATHHMEHMWKGPVRIWDIERGSPLVDLETTQGTRVPSLQFTDDDKYVIGSVYGKRVTPKELAVWDADTGKKAWTVPGADLIKVDPDSRTFVAACYHPNRQLVRFNLKTRKQVEVLPAELPGGLLRISPDLGSSRSTYNFRLVLHDLTNGARLLLWGDDQYKVTTRYPRLPVGAFHPQRPTLAAAAVDGTVRLWQTDIGSLQRILRGHSSPVQSVAYSTNGRLLATGDWAGEVRIWEPDIYAHHINCRPRSSAPGQCWFEDIAFRFDGSNVVGYAHVQDRDMKSPRWSRVTTWDAESGLRLADFEAPVTPVTHRHRQAKFDATGERLATVGKDKTIRVIDVESGAELFVSEPFTNRGSIISISGNGNVVAASTYRGSGQRADIGSSTAAAAELRVWYVTTDSAPQEIWQAEFPGEYISALALDHSGQMLAFATGSIEAPRKNTLRLKTRMLEQSVFVDPTELKNPQLADARVSAMEFSGDGSRLAVCLEVGEMSIFDTKTGALTLSKLSVPVGIEDLAWHPSGNRLVGANRATVTIWDSEGHEIITLKSVPRSGDLPFDPAVAFSPDGSKIAATQWDNSINVWTAERPSAMQPDQTEQPDHSQRSTAVSSRQTRRSEYALHTMEKTVEAVPANPWYIAARGQLRAAEQQLDGARDDYLTAKRMLAGDEPCMFIHGDAYIKAPSIAFHEFEGYTLEAWIKNWNYMHTGCTYGVIAAQYPVAPTQYFPLQRHLTRLDLDLLGSYWLRPARDLPQELQNEWIHVAVTYGPEWRMYYTNGKYCGKQTALPKHDHMGEFYVADTELHNPITKGRGLLRSLRASNRVLYTEEFEPTTILDPDESSILLFDFTRDDGMPGSAKDAHSITDRSGNGNHGTLHAAWWLQGES
jgi:serine/threonine protein kinase/WD40 repeat protein